MGILARVHEDRSYTLAGSVKDPALAKLFSGGRHSTAGPVVNEHTMFTCAAVFNAVDQIASDVAKLPLDLKKRREGGGADDYVDAKAYKLMKFAPNPESTSMVFRRTLMLHALCSKGGYAEIERDGGDKATALWFLSPSRVEPFYDIGAVAPDGRRHPLRYRLDGKDVFETRDILHLQGLGSDPSGGFEMVHVAREAIGLALASQQFAAAFFGNGTRFGGILMAKDRDLDPGDEDAKAIQKSVADLHARADKAFRLLVLGSGFEYKETGIKPNESQMKEIRDQQVMEVARFFNMPLHKLKLAMAGAVSYSSVEMFDLDYYKGPILTWSTLWEQELNAKLISPLEWGRQFYKHNVRAFLRADFKTQNEGLALARTHGVVNADEWREYLDMNPQEGGQGKLYLVQAAQVPLSKLDALVDAQIAEARAKAEPPTAGPPPSDGNDRTALTMAIERAARAEALAAAAAQDAREERDRRIALEASGTASTQELTELRARERDANARAVQLAALAEELRAERAAALRDRDGMAQDLTIQTAARNAALDAAQRAETAAANAEEARAAAVRELEDARQAAREAQAAEVVAEQAATAARASAADDARRRVEAEQLATEATARAEAAAAALTVAEDVARDAAARADAARADADAARAQAQTIRDTADEELATVRAALATLEDERVSLSTRVAEAERQHAAAQEAADHSALAATEARIRAERLDAMVADLQAQLDVRQAQASGASATLAAELQALRVAQQTLADEHAGAVVRQRELEAIAAAAADAQREAEARRVMARREELDRLTAVLAAHRGLFVEAMGRMIRWETSKARRHQATPDKLRAWVESFYVTHEDSCCDALLPAVRVHLAWQQSAEDPVTVTRGLVRDHVAESVRQLRAVAAGDPDELHVTLERMLQRWEEDRPAALADRILREEIDYVRAYQIPD